LIDKTFQQLLGDESNKDGNYITIRAANQTGKTWIMQQVLLKLKKETEFDVVMLSLPHLSHLTDVNRVVQILSRELIEHLNLDNLTINTLEDFDQLFERKILTKPLILILDDFDELQESVIGLVVGFFRNIYNSRRIQVDKSTGDKDYLLHSLALIGVRSVLGVENMIPSNFNVQRNLQIPNFCLSIYTETIIQLFCQRSI
jgi:Cdc6-like AAA superfamily ATPase